MSSLGGPNSQNLGGVNFSVGAVGAEQATQQVNQTAAAVENLGTTAQTAGQKTQAAGNATAGFASSLKSSIAPVRGVVSALSGLVGIFSRIVGIVSLVVTAIIGLGKIFNEFTEAPKRAAKALEEFKKTLGESFKIGPENDLQKQIDDLAKMRDEFIKKVIESPDLTGEASSEAWRAFEKARQDAIDKYIDKLNSASRGAKFDREAKERIENQKALNDLLEFEQRVRDVIAEENEKEREKQRKHAQEMLDFLDDFQAKQTGIFNGSSTAGSLTEMVGLLTRLNNKTSGGRW